MSRVPIAALCFVVSCASILCAQSTNASLTGRITDPSTALIVDARVAAINTGTNVRYETTTNSSGEYYLANLAPGAYRMELEKSGFKRAARDGIQVLVQSSVRNDIAMQIGEVGQTVEVSADAITLISDDGKQRQPRPTAGLAAAELDLRLDLDLLRHPRRIRRRCVGDGFALGFGSPRRCSTRRC